MPWIAEEQNSVSSRQNTSGPTLQADWFETRQYRHDKIRPDKSATVQVSRTELDRVVGMSHARLSLLSMLLSVDQVFRQNTGGLLDVFCLTEFVVVAPLNHGFQNGS